LRERLNSATNNRYDDRLDFGDEGLTELRVTQYEVETSATDNLRELTKRMRGGSIGIAGPRGAGKTTLIHAFCQRRDTSDRRLTTVLSAPTRYEARDFILTLFGTLCDALLRDRGPLTAPDSRPQVRRYVLPLSLFIVACPLAYLAAEVASATWLVTALAVIAFAAVLASGILALRRAGPSERTLDLETELTARAERELSDIRFQQSFSEGYSGKLGLPIGAELSIEARRELAQRQRSFPEIVEALRSFLAHAAHVRGGVVIGIDELDKIEDAETAQQFLNEIKTIFGVEGCIYLVSVSEEAMSSFERRGFAFRDVFDSAFDEVLRIDPLPFAQSKRLLHRRVVGLAPPYLALCHCLSGGLARDLLRVVRQLSLYNGVEGEDGRLAHVCSQLVRSELDRKVAAAAVAARGVGLEPSVSELQSWMRDLAAREMTATALMERALALPAEWLADIRSEKCEALMQLRIELAGFAYFLATVLEFFTSPGRDPERYFRDAELRGEDDERSAIDLLAASRTTFSVNARVAIALVDDFRASRRLTPLEGLLQEPPEPLVATP
jgi:hypothetical protein